MEFNISIVNKSFIKFCPEYENNIHYPRKLKNDFPIFQENKYYFRILGNILGNICYTKDLNSNSYHWYPDNQR